MKRRRKVDIAALVYSLVFGFSVGSERSIAGLRRAYERATGTSLVPSAFYDRFTQPMACLMERLVQEALGRLSACRPRLAGVFDGFREVLTCDGTIIRLHNALEANYPSIWTHYMRASARLHVVMNVVGRGAKTIRIAAGRTHELQLLKCGRWLKGRLLIFDLAYFRTELFRQIGLNGGYYLARLQKRNDPLIIESHHGMPRRMVGRRLKYALAHMRGNRTMDIDVELRYQLRRGPRRGYFTLPARIIGVRDPESGEMRLYVTNAPAELLDVRNVAAIYASRWEVELLFRELKAVYRLEEIPTRNRWVSECLIYAALLTLLVSRKLHRWLVSCRPRLKDRVPLDRFAVLLETFSHDILDVLVGPRAIREQLARRLKWLLLHEAIDPNRWRMHLTERAQRGTLDERRWSP